MERTVTNVTASGDQDHVRWKQTDISLRFNRLHATPLQPGGS